MILDRTGDFSFHQETIAKLVNWKPPARYWKKVENENFGKMAHSIDVTLIENCHWFERMWVVQEVCAADFASILVAGTSISLDDFLRAYCYLHYTLNVPIRNFRKLIGLEKIRQGWNNGKRHPLLSLIRECRQRQATDPRDKIYSLLGLMGDTMNQYLKPDYKKPVAEVYANASLHFITQSESLDPLCGWQSEGRQAELPSWVPDYNLNQELVAVPLVAIDSAESIFNASGYDARVKLMQPDISVAKFPVSIDWRHFPTKGLVIDSIALLSGAADSGENFGDIENKWLHTIFKASGLLKEISQKARSSLEQVSAVVAKYSYYWNTIGGIASRSSLHVASELDSSPEASVLISEEPANNGKQDALEPIAESYISTLLCGRISPDERLTSKNIIDILSFIFSAHHSTTDASTAHNLQICKSLNAGMKHRKLAISNSGHMCAVPKEAREADLLCVLFGCSVPVVLRRLAGKRDEYAFIGECYLHGFMDAEAIVLERKGRLVVDEFKLS